MQTEYVVFTKEGRKIKNISIKASNTEGFKKLQTEAKEKNWLIENMQAFKCKSAEWHSMMFKDKLKSLGLI